MSIIKNVPEVKDEEITNVRRAAVAHRGDWTARFYLEAKKDGIDLEPVMRRAIMQKGIADGEKQLAQMGNPEHPTAKEYGEFFIGHSNPHCFEKHVFKDTEDEYIVDLHYCPLVAHWLEMGLDDETVALLCDIAMEGDRGIAEGVGVDFDLQSTIARGDEVCRLCYKTRK